MEKKPDRRIRRTKAQLRHGLAQLMAEKSVNEVTVKELVDLVDINRSTFYLHYTDIYNMLESVENELFEEILHTIRTHPVSPFNENSFPFIEDIFAILFENREICAALLGPHGDIAFLHRIEEMLSHYSMAALREAFPTNIQGMYDADETPYAADYEGSFREMDDPTPAPSMRGRIAPAPVADPLEDLEAGVIEEGEAE